MTRTVTTKTFWMWGCSSHTHVRHRFGGASALEDDRAARRMTVDEHGVSRRLSDDIWSNATSRCDAEPVPSVAQSRKDESGAHRKALPIPNACELAVDITKVTCS